VSLSRISCAKKNSMGYAKKERRKKEKNIHAKRHEREKMHAKEHEEQKEKKIAHAFK